MSCLFDGHFTTTPSSSIDLRRPVLSFLSVYFGLSIVSPGFLPECTFLRPKKRYRVRIFNLLKPVSLPYNCPSKIPIRLLFDFSRSDLRSSDIGKVLGPFYTIIEPDLNMDISITPITNISVSNRHPILYFSPKFLLVFQKPRSLYFLPQKFRVYFKRLPSPSISSSRPPRDTGCGH